MPNIIDVVISYVGSIEHILRVTKLLEPPIQTLAT